MSAEYDVDARLSEGRSAVDDFAEYVRACQQLGHQHPELSRLAERYAPEEGLNLSALDADAAALAALAAAADDAVRQQADLVTALSGSWVGSGAAAALDFLRRHQRAAATVAAELHEAAGTLAALREELWRAVDAKVGATLAIDARSVGQRAAWLAAAHTVATGAGDQSVASELIEQQVEPFVDNDIRSQWVAALRAGTASATAAYDAAVARLRAGPQAVFEVPGALGPEWIAPVDQHAPVAAGPSVAAARDPLPSPVGGSAGVVPAAVAMPAAPPASGFAPPAPFVPEPPPTGQPAVPPTAAAPLGDVGGGVPGLGSGAPALGGMGLSGIGQQLSDLIGGLVGTSADAAPELPEVDPPDLGEADPLDDADEHPDGEAPDGEDPPDADADADADAKDDESADAAVESATNAPDDTEGPTEEPQPQPAPTPVPSESVPPIPPAELDAPPGPKTPCEIAADELPQVGG